MFFIDGLVGVEQLAIVKERMKAMEVKVVQGYSIELKA